MLSRIARDAKVEKKHAVRLQCRSPLLFHAYRISPACVRRRSRQYRYWEDGRFGTNYINQPQVVSVSAVIERTRQGALHGPIVLHTVPRGGTGPSGPGGGCEVPGQVDRGGARYRAKWTGGGVRGTGPSGPGGGGCEVPGRVDRGGGAPSEEGARALTANGTSPPKPS